MKKQITLIAILLCFSSLLNAQWQKINSFPEYAYSQSIVFINDTMIVSHTGNVYDMTPGTYTSLNYGVTWSEKNTTLGIGAFPLIKDGSNLYAGTWGEGVYLSTDKGESWSQQINGLPYTFPVLDLVLSNTDLYVCGTGGVFYSTDSAKTWQDISFPGTSQARSIVNANGVLIASFNTETTSGNYKSTDNGANWTPINSSSGLADSYIRKFAFFNNIIFAAAGGMNGSENAYVSTNGGESWVKSVGLDDQEDYNSLYSFISYNEIVFIATKNGVYKSIDNGLNFTNTGCPGVSSLAIARDTLYAGGLGIWKRALSELAAGVNEKVTTSNLSLYPNPASDRLYLMLPDNTFTGCTKVNIYNAQGQLVSQQLLNGSNNEVNISGLAKGIYLLKTSLNSKEEVSKFIKN
jgi:hypothetical protein